MRFKYVLKLGLILKATVVMSVRRRSLTVSYFLFRSTSTFPMQISLDVGNDVYISISSINEGFENVLNRPIKLLIALLFFQILRKGIIHFHQVIFISNSKQVTI